MTRDGFAAITSDGQIVIDTVSSTDRAAMVNWLVVHGQFMVPHGMGDFAIREHFDRLGKPAGIKVERVKIARREVDHG